MEKQIGFPLLMALLIIQIILYGCISNTKPAEFICSCKFECTNGYVEDSYTQNIGLENKEEINKCIDYAKSSCKSQGLDFVRARCEGVYGQDEFNRIKGSR